MLITLVSAIYKFQHNVLEKGKTEKPQYDILDSLIALHHL